MCSGLQAIAEGRDAVQDCACRRSRKMILRYPGNRLNGNGPLSRADRSLSARAADGESQIISFCNAEFLYLVLQCGPV